MKRLVKRVLRAVYRRTGFLRRPIRKEFEALFKGCVAASFDEVRLVMEDLVVEVYRLQDEVSGLKDEIARLRDADRDRDEDRTAA